MSKDSGMKASTDRSAGDSPLCKSTQVRMFDKMSSQCCSRPVEFRTVCANVVQKNK